MSVYAGPEVVNDSSLLLSIDMANIQSYPNTGTVITNTARTNTNSSFTLVDSSYYTIANGTVQFTRTTAPTAKDGAGMLAISLINQLTAQNFLYNDHTWEVWFRIDDRNPGAYDGSEGYSAITAYRGYHAGYVYTASTMYYYIWNNATSAVECARWTVGASGAQINQGSWYQMAVTRAGNVFTPYINGVNLGTGSTSVTNYQAGVTGNDIGIGKVIDPAAGTNSFVYYSKSTFSNMKMYNRALTAAEINRNFNALRGRFNI